MKDLNFFEPYIEKKEFHINKKVVILSFGAIFIFFIIVLTIFNQVKISKLNKGVSNLRAEVEDEEKVKKLEVLKPKEDEINYLKEKMENLKRVDEYITENDIINEFLLQTITSRTPENIFLNSIDIDTSLISIEGTSRDKYSVAEFEHSLKDTEGFIENFISNIYLDNCYYNFTLNIKLRGDENDNGGQDETEEVQSEESNTTDEE